MKSDLLNQIKEIVASPRVLENEPLLKHTTFKVGGKCDLFISIKNVKEAENIIRLLSINEVPYFVIGNGSNLLVADSGYEGVIVEIGRHFSDISVEDNILMADAGASLVSVANEAFNHELGGLEFASGIPGTVGGGIFMNAGAYGGELKDVVKSVTVLNRETEKISKKTADEMRFSYRHSIAKEEPLIILSAEFELNAGNKNKIKTMMDDFRERRLSKQPLEYPSAGSTFKRPEGFFAGKLIEDAGLKGYTVGGAQVSHKHSGFVINTGNATASDILTLIKDVRRIVFEKSGVLLEPEVCMLGCSVE